MVATDNNFHLGGNATYQGLSIQSNITDTCQPSLPPALGVI